MKSPIIDEDQTLERSSMDVDAKQRLIVALDFASASEAMDLVQKLNGLVSLFKVGTELHFVEGNAIVVALTSKGKEVYLDLKYDDVPETIERSVRRVASAGARFLTIHGNGPNVDAAIQGRKNAGNTDLKLLSVKVLTSLDARDLEENFGQPISVEDLVLRRAEAALKAGCDGVIASGREARKIRERIRDRQFLIVTPGIRPEGYPPDDQKRRVTPREAIVAGADYLVVGRPITRDPNPFKAAERILAEMQEGFDALRSA